MASLVETPAQTVGPFFHRALPYDGDSALVTDAHAGAVHLHGMVYDGAGDPVPDALVELWQPDSDGNVVQQPGSLRRDGRTFTGWGRSATDPGGRYRFSTVAPGSATPGRPAFFAIAVFARGLLNRLFTRAYLPGGDFEADPLLAGLDPARRRTLICIGEADAVYRFDIHVQGRNETVFLDHRGGRR